MTYLATLGKITSQNVPKGNTNYTNYLDKPDINSIFIEEIDYLHLIDLVRTLKPKISCFFDQPLSKLIKETVSIIIHPLTFIINRYLNTGIIPDEISFSQLLSFRCRSTKRLQAYYLHSLKY